MKKVWIVCIIVLILFMPKVGAEGDECQTAQLGMKGVTGKSVSFHTNSTTVKTGIIYYATLSANGRSSFAFCLDAGKSANNGGRYILDSSSTNISSVMKKAYAYLEKSNGEHRFIIAQVAIWLDQAGSYSKNQLTIAVQEVFRDIYGIIPPNVNPLIEDFVKTGETSTKLYVFKKANGSGSVRYQRFLAGIKLPECPTPERPNQKEDHYYCPAPYEDKDITSCVNSKSYSECVLTECPSNACRNGYATTVVANPAVCTNSNSTNTGHFYEVVNMNECGDADEEGYRLQQSLGEYCGLYCTEEVTQKYPGGISNPITVGTNLVWPTSAASMNSTWGNNFSLSYTGVKTCKVGLKPGANPIADIQKFTKELNNYTDSQKKEFNDIRKEHGTSDDVCNDNYAADLKAAKNAVNAANKAVSDADKAVSAADKAVSDASSGYTQCVGSVDSMTSQLGEKRVSINNKRDQLNNLGDCGGLNGQNICLSLKETLEKEIKQLQSEISSLTISIAGKQNLCKNLQQTLDYANNTRKNALNTQATARNNLNNANTNLSNLNKKITACGTYMKAYNSAFEVLKEINTCNSYKVTEDMYQFDSDTSISYSDDEFGSAYKLIVTESKSSCYGCGEYTGESEESLKVAFDKIVDKAKELISGFEQKVISIEKNVTYSLPQNDGEIYKYISKGTGKPLKTPVGDYIRVGYAFLPTSFDAKGTYNLNVIVNSLGENGKFTQIANSQPYTCNYSVTNVPTTNSTSCVCPVGTDYEGMDLMPYVYTASQTQNTMTCGDAQLKYCNQNNEKKYCIDMNQNEIDITACLDSGTDYDTCARANGCEPIPSLNCPSPKQHISLMPCLNDGYQYQQCYTSLCLGSSTVDEDYHCPNGTPGDWMDIDLHNCVENNIYKGFEAAKQFCKNTVCPGGKKVIYRTIDLYNPFPGKTASVDKFNTTLNFTLTNLKGRYPGSNWNSVEVVKKQILTNRGVEGDAVYQKEPLYSFVLDTDTVKEIRKYNDKQEAQGGYTDFTLNCSNGMSCISSFVRDKTYGLVSGACSNSTHGNFYECVES